MAKLDADMQSLVRRTILCFAATINGDGSPNLSPKSTLIVHDDDHLLFSNMASTRTVASATRPRIEINCVDIFSRPRLSIYRPCQRPLGRRPHLR